ncbi:hypothetical protein [Paenibacillus donghaensis]|uniref:Uncharacterized protein n=1 Tax=Paenibacillus donghaensis TaxID=414771 RepID=A0A2Z2K9D4_9BACL|nr:hypothetical protein [Paenibacillus donghaensis]ASA22064.1 hypothetical protein B9T62_15545 [Paenibacillus donghaensis]
MRLGADLKSEIAAAEEKPTKIKMNPYTLEDIRQDKGCQSDLIDWFPNGGITMFMIPIEIEKNVKKWEFKFEL